MNPGIIAAWVILGLVMMVVGGFMFWYGWQIYKKRNHIMQKGFFVDPMESFWMWILWSLGAIIFIVGIAFMVAPLLAI
jgi:uncharacterized membrane protein YidH (DUF202 family)